MAVDLDPAHTLETELDRPRIGAGADDEVVLQAAFLVAVEDEVDAGIGLLVSDLGVLGDVGSPLLRIVADEVVAPSRQWIRSDDPRRGARADELHSQRGRRGVRQDVKVSARGALRCVDRQQHGRRRQLHRVTRAAGEELDRRVGLPAVDLEAERQLAIGGGDRWLSRDRRATS